jgi:FtsH-binding integral membrane protein
MALEPTGVFQRMGAGTGTMDAATDAGLRSYMLKVYNYVGSGLALSGIVAVMVVQIPALFNLLYVMDQGYLQRTMLWWVVALAPLGMLFLMHHQAKSRSVGALQATYWIFCALFGASIAHVLVVYTGGSVARVFFITAATFGAMSLYGYTTKRNLSGMGSFLMMGLIGIVIAMVVNIFLQSAAMQFVISIIGVLIFVGLTAYDTQQIKGEFIAHRMQGDAASKSAIMGAVRLYLDFLNLFMFLLHLMGNRN